MPRWHHPTAIPVSALTVPGSDGGERWGEERREETGVVHCASRGVRWVGWPLSLARFAPLGQEPSSPGGSCPSPPTPHSGRMYVAAAR